MTQQKVDSLPKTKQADFQIGYIWVALATAIFSGFAIGGHLAFVIGYNLPLGKGFLSFIQAHGHVQLVGWAGLFIIGMSLYFIPRLSSVPISQPQLIQLLPWLIAIGLLLRSVGHTTLPYIRGSVFFVPLNWVVAFSGLIEWYGILLYVSLLLGTIVGIQNARVRPALMSVRPYFCMMVAGFFLYTSINLVLLIQMALSKEIVVNQAWNEFAIHVFIGLVLLPVSLAFSVRTFPLYLRLPATDWHVRSTAYFYLFSFLLQVVPTAPLHFGRTAFYLSSLGMLLKGGVIFWMVWKLDILTRLQEPWTTQRALQPGPHRRPTRPGIPDYGEFGRFERLVYAAYAWLILGAFLEMLIGGSTLFGHSLPISTDVVRHTYLLGFITNLILGMSVRMIPGFMRKRRVASTKLVDATFWLGNIAAVGRVLPLILPSVAFEAVPGVGMALQSAFAISGIMGLGAVICLAINLWKSVVQQPHNTHGVMGKEGI